MSQALGINDLGLPCHGLQLLGGDLEGDPCGKNLLLLRWRGGTQREAHVDVIHGSPICSFIQPPFTTGHSLPGPAVGSGRQGEHSPSQISWFRGEAGT